MHRCSRILVTCILFIIPVNNYLLAQSYKKTIETVAAEIALTLDQHERNKVSTIDFTDLQGTVNEFCRYIAELISFEISDRSKNYKYKVVTRKNLRNILKEYEIDTTGIISDNDVKKLGELSGVDILIVGSVVPLKTNFDIMIKAISTITAENIGAWNIEIERSDELNYLWEGELNDVTSLSKSLRKYYKKITKDLVITLSSIDILKEEIIATLKVKNKSRNKYGIALRSKYENIRANNSGGFMTDNEGHKFLIVSWHGISVLRRDRDWVPLNPAEEITISFGFDTSPGWESKNKKSNLVLQQPFTMNVELMIAKSKSEGKPLNLYFRNIFTKKPK